MQQVARATSQHAGQYGPRGVDMRHHVHIPNLLPHVVRDFRPTGHATNPRIGAEEINRSVRFDCLSDEPNDASFTTHIRRDGEPSYFFRHHFGAFGIEVGHDHTSCTLSCKATTESAPDAVGAASYHHNFVLDFHLSVSTAGDRRAAVNYNRLPCYPITRTRREQHGHARNLLRLTDAAQRIRGFSSGQSLRVLPQSAREICAY